MLVQGKRWIICCSDFMLDDDRRATLARLQMSLVGRHEHIALALQTLKVMATRRLHHQASLL